MLFYFQTKTFYWLFCITQLEFTLCTILFLTLYNLVICVVEHEFECFFDLCVLSRTVRFRAGNKKLLFYEAHNQQMHSVKLPRTLMETMDGVNCCDFIARLTMSYEKIGVPDCFANLDFLEF